jgi:hypothetical protein
LYWPRTEESYEILDMFKHRIDRAMKASTESLAEGRPAAVEEGVHGLRGIAGSAQKLIQNRVEIIPILLHVIICLGICGHTGALEG